MLCVKYFKNYWVECSTFTVQIPMMSAVCVLNKNCSEMSLSTLTNYNILYVQYNCKGLQDTHVLIQFASVVLPLC